jgi:RND family efflux transporter MFP subunit
MIIKKFAVIIGTIIVVCAMTVLSFGAKTFGNPEETIQNGPEKVTLSNNFLKVSVSPTRLGDYRPIITGFGEVKPVHEIGLTSEISGRVTQLSNAFRTGQIVFKGKVLAQIDPTNYEQALAQAQSSLEEAKLALLEEERQSKQVLSEWKRSGVKGKPASELVLRKPQLAFAQAKLKSAEANVKKEKRDLDNTLIRAPFNSLIVTRDIQPGSVIQTGTKIATLYSTDKVEIRVPLSDTQWIQLMSGHNDIKNQSVTIASSTGEGKWKGVIDRVEKHLSNDTRQRAVILSVSKPFEQEIGLFPGSFVQAHIEGAVVNNLWELPASSISQKGDIWFVGSNGQLNSAKVKRFFDIEDSTYVYPKDGQGFATNKIITRPLSHFRKGMLVRIKDEGL